MEDELILAEMGGSPSDLREENEELRRQLEAIENSEGVSDLLAENIRLRRQLLERKRSVESLRLIGSAVENAIHGIMILTPAVEEGGPRIAFVNHAFCRITGFLRQDVIAQTLDILRIGGSESPLRHAVLEKLFSAEPFVVELLALRRDGSEYAMEFSAVPVRGPDGSLTHWIGFVRDVSEWRARLVALERQAQHDVLTDLPNRVLLFDRTERAIVSQRRHKSSIALLMMDLDRFKEVNDSLGHEAGDLLLKQVAYRLQAAARQSDTVARLGGDEFALLLPDVGGARGAIDCARRILKLFQTPFSIDGRNFSVGASIGIALSPDHANDVSSLMRCSDIAMYGAKQGRTGFLVYSSDQDQHSELQLALESDLHDALRNGELEVHFQPIIDMHSEAVTRCEALVRWRHPREGLLFPDTFIPIAEKTGLVRPLTQVVLEDAIRRCVEWNARGWPIGVAVNLSPSSLRDAAISEVVSELLDRYEVDPHRLRLEITENSIMSDPGQALAVLSLMQTLGVSVALDDFGTGFSSLSNLRQVPFDEIKIDKSFVMDLLTREGDATIVRATIDLAHNLGRTVTAEGVETQEIFDRLLLWGCDLAQGYHISRPLTAEAFERWMESR